MNNLVIGLTLTSDVQLRTTTDNVFISEFMAAFPDPNPNSEEWHEIKTVAWGDLAKEIANLKIGSNVLVKGHIEVNSAETGTGKRSFPSIVATEIFNSEDLIPLNSLSLGGRIGGDPDIKYFESGSVVCKSSLAVKRNKTLVDWLKLEFWGQQAETASNYALKGTALAVEGAIKFDYWEDRQTQESRSALVVKVNRFTLLGRGAESEARPRNSIDYSQF